MHKSYSFQYAVYYAMRARCNNPNNTDYKNYGARGIKVCDKWMQGFDAFFADMGPCPHGYTIDRIDNDGDYSPENCRWADRQTQTNNRRNMKFYEHDGKRMTIGQWAKHLKIGYITIQRRLAGGLPLDLVFYPGRIKRWPDIPASEGSLHRSPH
jgi:hypothetical protein